MQDRDRGWSPWVRRQSPTPSADSLELDGIPLADLSSKGERASAIWIYFSGWQRWLKRVDCCSAAATAAAANAGCLIGALLLRRCATRALSRAALG